MAYLNINNTDFSSYCAGLKTGEEVLVSENSGRNANGDTVVDIVNRKYKVYVTFRPLTGAEMSTLLQAISSYVVDVQFLCPKTNSMKTIRCYHGTPEPEVHHIKKDNTVIYKQFSFNFIEL